MLVAIKSPKLLVTNKNVFFFSGTGRSSPWRLNMKCMHKSVNTTHVHEQDDFH
jgi:hypothetical protein